MATLKCHLRLPRRRIIVETHSLHPQSHAPGRVDPRSDLHIEAILTYISIRLYLAYTLAIHIYRGVGSHVLGYGQLMASSWRADLYNHEPPIVKLDASVS